jgi:hypothetical protein
MLAKLEYVVPSCVMEKYLALVNTVWAESTVSNIPLTSVVTRLVWQRRFTVAGKSANLMKRKLRIFTNKCLIFWHLEDRYLYLGVVVAQSIWH